MRPETRIFDDIARVAGGAVNLMSAIRQQVREEVQTRFDAMASKLDLVPREDFDRLEAMLEKARTEQEDLKKRIESLEKSTKKAAK